MLIVFDKLTDDVVQMEGEEPCPILGLDDDPLVRAENPVSYRVAVQLIGDELLVRGVVATDISVPCCECGVMMPVHIEEDSYIYSENVADFGESVDLTEDMREAIILCFPSYPVCRPGCKGLCPHCGAELNKGRCACKPPSDDRWAALDNIEGVRS